MQEEHSYFNTIVKEAIKDLKSNKMATLFYREQVEVVLNELKGYNISVKIEDDLYYLTNNGKKIGG